MGLAVRHNLDECFGQLEQAFDDVSSIAMPRALNALRDQAQTAGLRKLADIYDIGPRTMDQYVSVTFATSTDLEAMISVKGRGFPLAVFKPTQTALGVAVTIKGKRVVIPHTFIAKTASGHVGVFARGAYGGNGFGATTDSFGRFRFGRGHRVKRNNKWGSTELPISELYSFGPVEAFSNNEVTTAMQDRVDEQAAAVISKNIKSAVRGF